MEIEFLIHENDTVLLMTTRKYSHSVSLFILVYSEHSEGTNCRIASEKKQSRDI